MLLRSKFHRSRRRCDAAVERELLESQHRLSGTHLLSLNGYSASTAPASAASVHDSTLQLAGGNVSSVQQKHSSPEHHGGSCPSMFVSQPSFPSNRHGSSRKLFRETGKLQLATQATVRSLESHPGRRRRWRERTLPCPGTAAGSSPGTRASDSPSVNSGRKLADRWGFGHAGPWSQFRREEPERGRRTTWRLGACVSCPAFWRASSAQRAIAVGASSCERGFVLRGGRSLFLAAAAAYRGLCTAPPLRVVKRVPRRERLRILNQAEPCMVLFRVACFPLVENDKSGWGADRLAQLFSAGSSSWPNPTSSQEKQRNEE